MKTGLYGGTFSPPHTAHVRTAKLFCDVAGLDRIYVMPAGVPPHKTADEWGNGESRLEMARLAFGDFATVSDYEIKKEGRSYTVETLRYLKELHPEDELYMLVGEDMFLSLESWRAPDEIMSLCTVVAMRRCDTQMAVMEEAAEHFKEKYGAVISLIDADPLEVSSTKIREMLGRGEDPGELLPRKVFEYISENKLYRNDD